MTNIGVDHLRFFVEPAHYALYGVINGLLYGVTLNAFSEDKSDENSKKRLLESIVWGVAECIFKAYVYVAFSTRPPLERKLIDKAVVLLSGLIGTVYMYKTKSIGQGGIIFNAFLYMSKMNDVDNMWKGKLR